MWIQHWCRCHRIQAISQIPIREVLEFFRLLMNSIHSDSTFQNEILLPKSMRTHQLRPQPTTDVRKTKPGF